MPRMLAVDWDRHEVRYVLATTTGGTVEIRAAASVPLIDVVEGGGEPQPDLGHSLRAALPKEKVGRPGTLVAVGRGSIELLHLALPPAQDAELPELVLNQAMRESSSISEQSALDFVPLDDDPARPRHVTAAALSPAELERIKSTCAVAGLKPKGLLFRPYASAALFSRAVPDRPRFCLLVNLVGDEVDLTVLVEGKAAFCRTVRLPTFTDEDQATERVSAEIRRTLAVAVQTEQSPLAGEAIEAVYLFGRGDEHQELAGRIRRELGLSVTVFDPFEAVDASAARVPDHAGRFAPLLGMLLDEAHGRPHAIDFLHPRRRPRQISRRQVIAMASAAVAALVLLAGYFTWNTLAEIDATNRRLSGQLRDLTDLVDSTEQETKIVAAVRQWQAGNVLWLEELRELSLRFPPGEDVVILRSSMTSAQSGGGSIDLAGRLSHSSILAPMEQKLRDPYHRVRSHGVTESGQAADYACQFDMTILVARRDKSQYLAKSGRP